MILIFSSFSMFYAIILSISNRKYVSNIFFNPTQLFNRSVLSTSKRSIYWASAWLCLAWPYPQTLSPYNVHSIAFIPPSHIHNLRPINMSSLVAPIILILLQFLIFLHLAINKILASPPESSLTFEQFYQFGKNEYTMENWPECVAYMLRALESYRSYKEQIIWCRKMCHNKIPFSLGHQSMENDADWDFLQDPTNIFMRIESSRALCLLRCRIEKFPPEMFQSNSKVWNLDELLGEFENRRPFHYLQFCYWKLGHLRQATQSAFTYLVANPRDTETLENLHFYMEQPGFTHEWLTDNWQPSYQKIYMDAVHSYDKKEWLNCANLFRQALEQFWDALDDCRMECEDQLDWSAFDDNEAGNKPEWSVILTSFHVSVLRCRQKCLSKISILNGRDKPNLLVSHFEYLHLCQFNLKHGRDACQSVANALALQPKSIIMRRNKLFYTNIYAREKGGTNIDELFTISKEIRRFLRRQELERSFIEFVDEKFTYESLISPSGHSFLSIPSGNYFPPSDNFDYSKLLRTILAENECKFLRSAIDFFPGHFPRIHWLLVEELATRIGEMHEADPPEFIWIKCTSSIEMIDCGEKAPISVALNVKDCGKINGEQFEEGCFAAFCEK